MPENENGTKGITLPGFEVVINTLNEVFESDNSINIVNQFPLTFSTKNLGEFKFPLDPIISIHKKNRMKRRLTPRAKGTPQALWGTVKERVDQDDIEIHISGVFISNNGLPPKTSIKRLIEFLESPKPISVLNDILTANEIFFIVIESIDFPHTKGIENQAFFIKAYSDNFFSLEIAKN